MRSPSKALSWTGPTPRLDAARLTAVERREVGVDG